MHAVGLFENMYITKKYKKKIYRAAKINFGACTMFVCNTRQHTIFRNTFVV